MLLDILPMNNDIIGYVSYSRNVSDCLTNGALVFLWCTVDAETESLVVVETVSNGKVVISLEFS